MNSTVDCLLISQLWRGNQKKLLVYCTERGLCCISETHGTITQPNWRQPQARSALSVVLFNNTYVRKLNQTFFGKIRYIPNYFQEFAEVDKTWPEDPVLLVLGRNAKEKRPEMAVKIYKQVKQHITSLRIQFVGSGYDQQFLNLQKEFGNASVQIFSPTLEPQLFYANSTLLLFTSVGEGQPLVVSESLSCGLPVAMFNLGVENAREGTIIEPNKKNAAGLARRIEAVVTDRNELERLGKAGRQFIVTQFSKDRINRLWEEAVVSAY